MIGLEPGIRAAFAKGRDDPRVDGWIAEIFAGLAIDVDRDRHAPGALSRDHPIGPAFDHRKDAVLRALRHPAGLVERGERAVAVGSLCPSTTNGRASGRERVVL